MGRQVSTPRVRGQEQTLDNGCLICGVRHIGACSPDHPEHRPLSAEQWAERQAHVQAMEEELLAWEKEGYVMGADLERGGPPLGLQHNSEKETVMNHRDVSESPAPEGPAPERGHWQTFKERLEGWFSRAETVPPPPPQKDHREHAGEEHRYDVETPGPTEAAGGSFRVLPSKEAAEEYVQTLPPSHQNRIDQAHDAAGPTSSYVVTSGPLPSVKEVARDEYVAQQVAAIEDPATRARAEQLLQTIREEAATRERPTPARSQEVELER